MSKFRKHEFEKKKVRRTKPIERNKRFPSDDEKRIHDWKQLLDLVNPEDEDDLDYE